MFITFEGPEGSGKSTQIALLADYLRTAGYAVTTTREPGGTRIGDQIRDCLHDTANTGMAPTTEVLLYAASRAQLVSDVIRPALVERQIVLCDRYADSTLAYQGYGRGLDREMLAMLNAIATGGLTPDLTLLLDIDVRRGLARRRDQGSEMNRLDLEAVEFHERVRRGYHELAASDPVRWRIVDAAGSAEEVQAELRRLVMSQFRDSISVA